MPDITGKIKWDVAGQHWYETGVKNCALYVKGDSGYGKGVAWNGITAITESPSGAEKTALYADDQKYLNLLSAEDFGATIEAYTYPDEFMQCNGEDALVDGAAGVTIGQQSRKSFGLVYKTTIGNDESNDKGYKLHILYGCTASPSERAYSTINDSPEAITFSWEIGTVPETVTGKKPTACLIIDSTKIDENKLKTIEETLFGVDPDTEHSITGSDPTFMTPNQIMAVLNATG